VATGASDDSEGGMLGAGDVLDVESVKRRQ
jgi:hypothetical protein